MQAYPISSTEEPFVLTENMNLVTAAQLPLLFGCPNALSTPPATLLLAISPLINYQTAIFGT